MKLRTLLLLIGLLTTTAGCGTLLNLSEKNPRPYGGVRCDLVYLNHLHEVKGDGTGDETIRTFYDLAATCVLDTVSLPYVLVRAAIFAHAEKEVSADDHGYLNRDHNTDTGTTGQ